MVAEMEMRDGGGGGLLVGGREARVGLGCW